MSVSNEPWGQFSQSDYTPEQWAKSCLIDTGEGDPGSKDRYKLPVYEPDGELNRNGVHAAAERLNQVQGVSPDKKAAAARKLISLYGQVGDEPPDHLRQMAGQEMSQRAAPVEQRAATLSNVDFGERILTVIAVPYEQPTPVEYRSEMWQEVFSRSAFNGFDPGKRRVPVTAVLESAYAGRPMDHVGGHLVGKVAAIGPDRPDGLVLDMRISNTAAGDEALQLASDDALSPSVGFSARPSDHALDRRSMTRRVNRAFLDHVALVPVPAYSGAKVLSMRDAGPAVSARDLPRLVTPSLDEYLADPVMRWADDRLNRA